VRDDGVGPTSRIESHDGRGLRNIEDRARRHGGSSTLLPLEPRGSVLRWSVPLLDLDTTARAPR
jgi:signal transduction histidine kinase